MDADRWPGAVHPERRGRAGHTGTLSQPPVTACIASPATAARQALRCAAFCLLLAAHASSSAAQSGGATDFYSQLVTIPSSVYGEVTKAGPMPAERYDDKLFNHSAFREWLLQRVVYKEDAPATAPMSYKCGVFVNHHYKLIFIRNRKAASTTVLNTFKVACKTQSKLLCMRPFNGSELHRLGLSHDDMWRSYYVVSSTRNPWARAASGFDYTQDRWPSKTGLCGQVAFDTFCSDPYVMGKMANLFHCGAQGSFRGDDAWAYDFYHVEPAHHCMTDASGAGLSVDYLIRYEHLHQDFAALIEILNRRRDPALPEIREGKMRWMKQGVHVQVARANASEGGGMWREDEAARVSSDRHAARYRACGEGCVRGIAAFFSEDMRLMKMRTPSRRRL